MGDTLFHLLPQVSSNSSKSMNLLTTSIVLITIAVMLLIDSALHVRSQVNNQVQSAAAAPQPLDAKGGDLEMQRVAAGANEPSSAIADPSVPSAAAAAIACLPPSAKPPRMSLLELLKQPEIIVNLTGEALHNFTDGIAIAAAFSLSWTTGAPSQACKLLPESSFIYHRLRGKHLKLTMCHCRNCDLCCGYYSRDSSGHTSTL